MPNHCANKYSPLWQKLEGEPACMAALLWLSYFPDCEIVWVFMFLLPGWECVSVQQSVHFVDMDDDVLYCDDRSMLPHQLLFHQVS